MSARSGPGYTPVRTADGSWTLAHPGHGETLHSRSGAWQEAVERYATPCRLRERALAGRAELHLLDVGTGLGLNLAAALAALEGTGTRLIVVSLERDRSVIEAAFGLDAGPGERWHAPVRVALRAALPGGLAETPGGRAKVELGAAGGELRLLLGDARATLPRLELAPRFDAVFLDPFSPRVEPELWEAGFLVEIARRMAPGSLLSTFSAATRVRVALAGAGLAVARGPRVGTKAEGTLAGPDPADVARRPPWRAGSAAPAVPHASPTRQ
ncbi:MAG: MnmC family methyltransferase [Planctomycetota bacterium]|nr:MnmC family methyltransferase [Planctomycetota bacterium]